MRMMNSEESLSLSLWIAVLKLAEVLAGDKSSSIVRLLGFYVDVQFCHSLTIIVPLINAASSRKSDVVEILFTAL